MTNKQGLWVGLIAVVCLAIAALVFVLLQQRSQLNEMQQLSEQNKEELAEEYNELSIQYEGYKKTIKNDSLIAKLEAEQLKVQQLEAELKKTKSTDAKRIGELKKELDTLRKILREYVQQIDSLNRVNQQLTAENQQIRGRYQEASQTVSQLTEEKEKLTETVQLASKLDAGNIVVTGLTNKNKATDKIKKMVQIRVSFVINKNITAVPGEKTIYIRIQKPDDEVLTKSRSNTFVFEDKEINYSSKRTIEYGGEEFPMEIYWPIEEYLAPGTYRVDIFADGNVIGRKSFKLEN
ncbi:MAG: hypothetical protein LBR64_06500 [Dysgonamonadaceae bacterium]|jgi:chromosome segregation ATPase|nr:hypothetical protein [Dysgonamonadaceae bacterium]